MRHAFVTAVTLGVTFFVSACNDGEGSADCQMPFTEYNAGDSVAGLELEARVPNCGSRRFVGYVYGTCEPEGDSGCAPPLEVQSWSYGDRKPSRAPEPHEIHLRRGDVTVVIFARNDRLSRAAADALRTVD